jgi:hypothetical protein
MRKTRSTQYDKVTKSEARDRRDYIMAQAESKWNGDIHELLLLHGDGEPCAVGC